MLSVDFVLGTEVDPQRKLTERSSNSDKMADELRKRVTCFQSSPMSVDGLLLLAHKCDGFQVGLGSFSSGMAGTAVLWDAKDREETPRSEAVGVRL